MSMSVSCVGVLEECLCVRLCWWVWVIASPDVATAPGAKVDTWDPPSVLENSKGPAEAALTARTAIARQSAFLSALLQTMVACFVRLVSLLEVGRRVTSSASTAREEF